MKLASKVAIVRFRARGIAAAIAFKLASDGGAVVVNDLGETPAKATVAAIEAAGGKAVACVGSVVEATGLEYCSPLPGLPAPPDAHDPSGSTASSDLSQSGLAVFPAGQAAVSAGGACRAGPQCPAPSRSCP